MKLLRNIALDLWDQRLWPAAVVMIAALLAVPMLLGGAGPEPPQPPAPATAASALSEVAQVGLAQPGAPGARRRDGALRDPFARRSTPPAPLSTTPRPSGGAEAPSSGGGSDPFDDFVMPGITPLPGGGGGSPPSTSPSAPPAGDVVTVRVGRSGDLKTRRDVITRSPLPSTTDPFLVYLGNKPDGRSAQFLIASDAVPTGDGKCRPNPDLCEEIVMQAGETTFFDLTVPGGEVVQYQLDVVRVGRGGGTADG